MTNPPLRTARFLWILALWILAETTLTLLAGAGTSADTITFPSEDGLAITADVYAPNGITDRPMVVLFHQAGYSRGEYCEIAPRLNSLGFACIAVDQRSGNQVNGVVNETAKLARAEGRGTQFTDAVQDMRAALAYARAQNGGAPVIGMGSSYSSSLILTIAADHPELVDGTLSFSPGEYFDDSKRIQTAAASVNVPAFITSARSEQTSWAAIFGAIAAPGKISFIPESAGRHGASTLWPTTAGNSPTWDAVENFLGQWLSTTQPALRTGITYNPTKGEISATFSHPAQVVEASSDLTHWFAVTSVSNEQEAAPVELIFPTDKSSTFLRSRPLDQTTTSADVTAVTTSGADGRYTFNVTIRSTETGCDQYADWWEVLNADGELLARRVLTHSHVAENPFTRSGPVTVDADTLVWVRAHMNHSGYGGMAMTGSVATGFQPAELPASFAPWVVTEGSLPDGCAF